MQEIGARLYSPDVWPTSILRVLVQVTVVQEQPVIRTQAQMLAAGMPTCDWMIAWLPLKGDLRSLSRRWRLLRLLRWSCCRNFAI